MADKYLLRVTAGPNYDPTTHVVLPVNKTEATQVVGDHCTANIQVRVQNYRGLPRNSPSTAPYFSHDPHTHDRYSITFSFVPHSSVSGANLVFGNDFDRPIRDRLPPFFDTAFSFVKRLVDPGLEGDVKADKPYLYGPALSSINVVRVGKKASSKSGQYELGEAAEPAEAGPEEGGVDEEAEQWRRDVGAPESAAERKKWALKLENRARWEWEAGRVYTADFFNPYLDFNEFALRLPIITISILGYMDGKDQLRYVLKDKETGNVFFVVVFTLVLKDDVAKQEAEDMMNGKVQGNGGSEDTAKDFEPSADDVD